MLSILFNNSQTRFIVWTNCVCFIEFSIIDSFTISINKLFKCLSHRFGNCNICYCRWNKIWKVISDRLNCIWNPIRSCKLCLLMSCIINYLFLCLCLCIDKCIFKFFIRELSCLCLTFQFLIQLVNKLLFSLFISTYCLKFIIVIFNKWFFQFKNFLLKSFYFFF